MRTAKVQASLRIRAVSPEPMLFANEAVDQGKTSAKELGVWLSKGPGMRSERFIWWNSEEQLILFT